MAAVAYFVEIKLNVPPEFERLFRKIWKNNYFCDKMQSQGIIYYVTIAV